MKTDPLFVSDAEIAKLVGLSANEWSISAIALQKYGLPKPDPLFSNKRYWPAVRSFLDRRYNLGSNSGVGGTVAAVDGDEQWTLPTRPDSNSGQTKQEARPVIGLQHALQKMREATP